MKKLLSILLAMVIVMSAFMGLGFSVSAESSDTLAVTVNGVTTEVQVGDTFTYTYTLSDMKILCVEAVVNYDSDFVSVVDVDEDDEAYSDFIQATFPVVYSAAVCNTELADTILYNFSTANGIRFVGENTLATFEFTALKAGETTINTEIIEMADSNKNYYVDKTPQGSEKLMDWTFGEFVTYEAPEVPETEPTDPPTEPTDPPTEPTDPPTEPTEPVKAEKVENVKVTADQISATLTWDAVDGAAKYWIYKYNNATEKYECVSSSLTTSCVVKNLDQDTEYKFKVTFSDDDSYFSPLAKADEVTVTTLKGADIETITGTARLVDADVTWEPVDGAVKYWLYKAWDENGPFYCYDATTSTSYTVRRLQADTDYYFKVITVTEDNGNLILSKLDDAPTLHVRTEAAEKIKVKIDSVDNSSISFSWPAFENAQRYWIKFSNTTKNTNLKEEWITYTSVDASVTSFTLNGRKANTPYYITIEVEYPDPQTGKEFANYIPADTKTWYSNENFFTFEKSATGGLTVSWPEDVNSPKSWMYVYDKDGNLVISNSTTTNSVSFSYVTDWENCTYALKTMDADSTGRLITPELGWAYK